MKYIKLYCPHEQEPAKQTTYCIECYPLDRLVSWFRHEDGDDTEQEVWTVTLREKINSKESKEITVEGVTKIKICKLEDYS